MTSELAPFPATATDAQARLSPRPGLLFAPVRHHSPRCAHHLHELFVRFAPQIVLIEGPDELNAMMPMLQHKQTRPPIAAYLHAVAGEDGLRCRGYIPFTPYSPEWVALREAAGARIPAHFIDVPFAQRLTGADNGDYFARSPEPTLLDEPRYRSADVFRTLAAQSGCHDFDSWWDRHFESGVTPPDAFAYFASLLSFGQLLRGGQDDTEHENLHREAHMAGKIRAALSTGQRCLVVCGAYHVQGITDMLDGPAGANRADAALEAIDEVGVHLIPYPLERLERAHRYGAGIPAPGYYQRVWQAWQAASASPYQEPFPVVALELADALRAQGMQVTLPDAIEAVSMTHRLGALRACRAGLGELCESLQSTMVKDASDLPAFSATLLRLLGQGTDGVLPPNLPLPPLLAETKAFCLRNRLPSRLGESKPKDLDIYRSARHRAISQFLHQLNFLDVPYAERRAGPDFIGATDLGRVRETWTLKWVTETATALTESSRYGASLADAAVNKLLELLAQPSHGSPADLVLQVLVTGLDKVADKVLDAVETWLSDSYEPMALAQGTVKLALAYEARLALGGVGLARLLPLLERAFTQTCIRLPWLGITDPGRSHDMLESLDDLHGMIKRQAVWTDAALFYGACASLHDGDVSPQVKGGAAGILTVSHFWTPAQTTTALSSTFALAHMAPQSIADYMHGFLRIAHTWLLASPDQIYRLSDLLASWSEDDFLTALPSMRLAFSQLSRREIRDFASVLTSPAEALAIATDIIPDAQTLQQSRICLEQVSRIMQRWGVGHD